MIRRGQHLTLMQLSKPRTRGDDPDAYMGSVTVTE